jgi:uncharacterized protein (DUF58 family)
MSISPRTRRRNRDAWLAAALLLLMSAGSAAARTFELQCSLTAPASVVAGQPVPLRFTLANRGPVGVQVLEWGTPFEGWFGAYVEVSRDGVAVAYRGPMVKRGDPAADEYLRIAPHRARRAEVDLAQPFDLSVPGVYRMQPRITLFDVAAAGSPAPRSRDRHVPLTLSCPAFEVRVQAH